MKMILKKVHIYWYVICVALSYFIFWPFFNYYSKKPSRYRRMNSLRRAWAFMGSAMAGFFYNFKYEVPIDWSKTYIICPNHSSNLDIAAMCILVNSTCRFMGKQELEDGLVTGIFFRSVDIPVNRDSKMSSFRAFKKASEKLQEGISLIIFPEGMISENYPPKLCEFKNGPFRLAIEHKIPILPVTSANTWELLWDTGTKYGSRPGICHFYVHKPIDTANLAIADADALRDQVYDVIKNKLLAAEKLYAVN
jgi:1-acyl-sn-glycerol-3-phosphate acyltransferase